MDGSRVHDGIHGRLLGVPVGGDAEDGCDIRILHSQTGKEFPGSNARFEGQGGGPVRDKDCWKTIRCHEAVFAAGAKNTMDPAAGLRQADAPVLLQQAIISRKGKDHMES